jgi:hypothetical protein
MGVVSLVAAVEAAVASLVVEMDSTVVVAIVLVVAARVVEVDAGYLVVVAVASLHNLDCSVVVAQGSPFSFTTTQHTFITLGEMRNMRKITTAKEELQQSSSKCKTMQDAIYQSIPPCKGAILV